MSGADMSGSGSDAPLVFIEVRRGAATPGSLALLATARRLAGAAAAVVCGPDSEHVARTLPGYGADEVWFADQPTFDAELPGPIIDAVAGLIVARGFATVLLETSVAAVEVAASLSARFDAGVNWDLQDVEMRDGQMVGTRLALGDTVVVDVGWTGELRLASFRLGVGEPVEQQVPGSVQRLEPSISSRALRTTIHERRDSTHEGAQLVDAAVIVAGGRGVRDAASLQLLEALASALGGMVAVSMPLVDRGWYPVSAQVGQTGQKVRPRLYIACGISGSLAHRVGMEKSGTIIAINSDPSASIFGLCDAGVVGDLHEVVPELTRLIRARRAAEASAAG